MAVVAVYESGAKVRDIPAMLGISQNTFLLRLKEARTAGLLTREGKKPRKAEDTNFPRSLAGREEEIRTRFSTGESTRDMAKSMGTSLPTMGRALASLGLRPEDRPDAKVIDAAALRDEYLAGASLEEVGKRHRLSPETVIRRLLDLGVTIRRPGWHVS